MGNLHFEVTDLHINIFDDCPIWLQISTVLDNPRLWDDHQRGIKNSPNYPRYLYRCHVDLLPVIFLNTESLTLRCPCCCENYTLTRTRIRQELPPEFKRLL